MKQALYGIKSIKVMDVADNGAFPLFNNITEGVNGVTIKAIVRDSFTFSDSAPSQTTIDVEEVDTTYLALNSDDGTLSFSFGTYDMSEECMKYFQSYTEGEGANEGFLVAAPQRKSLVCAVQVVTREQGDIPSFQMEWAKLKIEVARTGTLGKSGLPNLTLTCTEVANLDNSGKAVPNFRRKAV